MRSGIQVSGSAIERVFTLSTLPPRRFRGALDAALTLALGSACAFALTLGPAPLNTVAVSSAADASLGGQFDPSPGLPLVPAEVGSEGSSSEQDETRPTPSASDLVAQSTVDSSTAGPPAPAKSPQKAEQPPASPPAPKVERPQKAQQPQKPNTADAPELISPSAALSVVQNYRLGAGLAAFVTADACAQSTVYASVAVTPSALLPPGLAKKSLAPDPAFATVSGTTGALTVTVHACQ